MLLAYFVAVSVRAPASMTGWVMLNILVNGVEKIGCEDGMVGSGEELGPRLRPLVTYMYHPLNSGVDVRG